MNLDAGNGAESTAFRDSSGVFTDEAGVFATPEWLRQWGHGSVGRPSASSRIPE